LEGENQMILYFTGTGNSSYVANAIAKETGDQVLSLNEMIKKGLKEKITSVLPLVVVVPTYAWRIPRVVSDFIKQIDFSGNRKIYFVLTCGDSIGAAERYTKKLCDEKELQFMGCAEVVMPENYIAMYTAPEKEKAHDIIRKSEALISDISNKIKEEISFTSPRIKFSGKILSGIVNNLFYKFFVKAKGFYATDSCNSCGYCVRNCPLNNIRLEEKSPVWGKDCTHCMACICGCPTKAIEYGKNSKGKVRYQCPNYPMKENT